MLMHRGRYGQLTIAILEEERDEVREEEEREEGKESSTKLHTLCPRY